MTRSPSLTVYHAALLDYVVSGSESGLTSAYELGRTGFHSGAGLLHIVNVHDDALGAILDSTPAGDELRRRVRAASRFLSEALSPFEMACHGYRELLSLDRTKPGRLPHIEI